MECLNYLSLSWGTAGWHGSSLFPLIPQPGMSQIEHLPRNTLLSHFLPSSPVISCWCTIEYISQWMLLNLFLLCFLFFAKSVLTSSNLIGSWCYRRNSVGVFWEAGCRADLHKNRKSARQFCWVQNNFVFLSISTKNSVRPFDLGWEVTDSDFALFRNAW